MNSKRSRTTQNRKAAVIASPFFIVMFLIGTAANANVGIRQGQHVDTGRLVFDFSGMEAVHTHRSGNTLTIHFTPPQPIAPVPLNIPGVTAMQGGNGVVQLQLSKGTAAHVFHMGNRVVVDAHTQSWRVAATQTSPPKPLPPVKPASPSSPGATIARLASPAKINPPADLLPASPPRPSPPASEVVNFTAQPGTAAFRRGNDAVLVFDTAEIPDISALQAEPGFASVVLISSQAAQIITLSLPEAESLKLAPVKGGWQITETPATPFVLAPSQAQTIAIKFPMPAVSKTVTISDPLTGGDLLVGTVTQPNEAANFTQSGPGFSVLPSWLGIAILPLSDSLGLATTQSGFELSSTAPGGLPLGTLPAQATAQETSYGQGLNLPNGGTAALRARMLSDLRAAASFAPLGRLTAQTALARDMLALGLGPEAKGVLQTAVLENPAAQDNGQIAGLLAVADVLARKYRPAEFTAPGMIASGELAFWKAAGQMQQGNGVEAAPILAANLAVFEAYPASLRNNIGAELAETLVDANQLQAAQQLVNSDTQNPIFDLARAKLLEAQGQTAAALADYQHLAVNRDLRISAIAEDRAIELQLAAGRLSAAQAADALDAALFDWRDAEHERHMRLRIAQLRATSGQWPQAFTMLAATRARFPAHQSEIDAARTAMFLNMLGSNQFAQMPPIQAVAILQQNQDLIPATGSAHVIDLLVQRLDELDLPGAAAPMLSHLIQTIPPGAARASLGARLAQVDLDAGSPVATISDLSQTDADNLPPALQAQRAILNAKAQAAAGNAVAAVSNLSPANAASSASTATLQSQAQIAEQSGQWPQAEQSLSALVTQAVPAAGPITGDAENLLLRLATAASHNGDTGTLSSLASQYGRRIGNDAAGQMFQTLTTPALTGDQGLNQALKEIAQLQSLPAMVDAVTAPSPR